MELPITNDTVLLLNQYYVISIIAFIATFGVEQAILLFSGLKNG